jgi:hypothetical protein
VARGLDAALALLKDGCSSWRFGFHFLGGIRLPNSRLFFHHAFGFGFSSGRGG